MAASMRTLKNDPQKNLKVQQLKALGATTFVGTTNSDDAKTWIDMLEKCFDVMECREDRKVRFASFLLQEGASDWWKSITSKRPESEITNWSEFKKAFYEEYYPQSYKDAKQNEFLKLVQGSMIVGAALRVERNISESKSQKEPSRNVCGFSTSTINTLSDKQFKDDTEFMPGVARHGTPKKKIYGKSSPTIGSSTTKQVKGNPSEWGECTINHNWNFQCKNCSKIHQDQCLKGTNICNNCGQSSHMRKECPLLMQSGNVSQPEQSKLQVGQGQHMVKAKATMKVSEGNSKVASPREPKSKQHVGTPCTHGKMFAMTQQKAQNLPK